jgi:hypothetical protein
VDNLHRVSKNIRPRAQANQSHRMQRGNGTMSGSIRKEPFSGHQKGRLGQEEMDRKRNVALLRKRRNAGSKESPA